MSGIQPYYDDGTVTLYHGDALELFPILWDSASAQVLITDPPYGLAYASNQAGRFQGHSIEGDSDTTARDAILGFWPGPAAVFGSWKCPRPPGVRAVLTWDKGEAAGMGDLSLPWKPNTEEIYILGKGWSGHRGSSILRGNVVTWSGPGPNGLRLHPNEKPVALMRQIVIKAPPGTIIDPFAGSGTTLRAAKDLGRHAIGIELEERYCQIAAQRCAQEVLNLGA